MFSDYELLDFGDFRRLERFGPLVTDRPCPAATLRRQFGPDRWRSADVRFIADETEEENRALGRRGRWISRSEKGKNLFFETDAEGNATPRSWTIRHADPDLTLELKGSPFGHLGVFPEQAENWTQIAQLCRNGEKKIGRPLRVLNLFAYTGGSSLAAAVGGAEVVHLDAARNIVQRAKRNAELSGWTERIRFIADDAGKFVRRELKRGNRYDGVILDPPSYGHGARGEVWRLTRDLPPLLTDVFALLDTTASFVLLTAHSPGFGPENLASLLTDQAGPRFGGKTTGRSTVCHRTMAISLRTPVEKSLDAGGAALWIAEAEEGTGGGKIPLSQEGE